MKLLKWQRCTILTSTQNLFLAASTSWSQQLAAQSVVAWPLQTFEPGVFDDKALEEIRKASVRVVLALAYSEDTVKVALTAFKHGMVSCRA